jgi:hypothetical protein
MKTKLVHEKGTISLVVDHGDQAQEDNLQVLAAMNKTEGTQCWMVIDIRLTERPVANPSSGSCNAEDVFSHIKPISADQSAKSKSILKEYEELEDGTLVWCTFKNIVRGQPGVNGRVPWGPLNFHAPVYHSRKDALELLAEMQAFWEDHEGTIGEAKIENPFSQPRQSVVEMRFTMEEAEENRHMRNENDGLSM